MLVAGRHWLYLHRVWGACIVISGLRPTVCRTPDTEIAHAGCFSWLDYRANASCLGRILLLDPRGGSYFTFRFTQAMFERFQALWSGYTTKIPGFTLTWILPGEGIHGSIARKQPLHSDPYKEGWSASRLHDLTTVQRYPDSPSPGSSLGKLSLPSPEASNLPAQWSFFPLDTISPGHCIS